jgi:quinol monooxygenase YgiN
MFARSTTFTGRPESVDDGIAMVRDEVMPATQEMDGCVGLSMLVDRDTGGCIVTTAWESEQALHASEPHIAPLRDRAQRLFGSRPQVRVWEIAVLHRLRPAPDGACARVTWTRIDPDRVDEQVEAFRTEILPRVEELPGFCSTSLLVDRYTGEGALATTYGSRDALDESRQPAVDLRDDTARRLSTAIVDVAEFEVALAHLRVPETV